MVTAMNLVHLRCTKIIMEAFLDNCLIIIQTEMFYVVSTVRLSVYFHTDPAHTKWGNKESQQLNVTFYH